LGNPHHTHDTATCKWSPSTDICSLTSMLFPSPLRHLDLSDLLYTAPLRGGAGHNEPHLILYMPLHFCFCLVRWLVMMNSFIRLLISFPSIFNFDFLFFMFLKLDVCVINLRGTMRPPSLERTLSLPVRDHRNTIRKYCSNRKSYSNNSRMDEKINRTRGSAGQVDQSG